MEHAYILQRYKEVHDFVHVLLGYSTTVAEEVAIKWFEMTQTELPMNALVAFLGPIQLLVKSRDIAEFNKLMGVFVPHILLNARTSGFYMNVYFEKHFETPLDELRS